MVVSLNNIITSNGHITRHNLDEKYYKLSYYFKTSNKISLLQILLTKYTYGTQIYTCKIFTLVSSYPLHVATSLNFLSLHLQPPLISTLKCTSLSILLVHLYTSLSTPQIQLQSIYRTIVLQAMHICAQEVNNKTQVQLKLIIIILI